MEASHAYDDIIRLPHHVSEKHPQMALSDRAAQFSPFAALTGYEAAVDETARLTDEKIQLSEDRIAAISDLLAALQPGDAVSAVYFVPDRRKAGGAYLPVTGSVKKVDGVGGALLLTDGAVIPFEDIFTLEKLP